MLDNIILFFQREWKRIAVIALAYAPIYIVLMVLTYRQGPQEMNRIYGQPGEYLLFGSHSVIEVTIIYYVLIFRIARPVLQTRNVPRFLLQILAFFLTLLGYEMTLNYTIPTPAIRAGLSLADFLVWHLFVDTIILGLSFAIALLIEWDTKNKRQEELEKQKMDAELAAIKYQINPHFLFNSLSFIYSRTLPLDQQVAHAVMLLSDIMSYALGREEDAGGQVDLARELTHMKNVIDMNQMRYNHRLNITYHEHLDNPYTRIVPLVLITLVENAFKHGDLSDPQSPLLICLETSPAKLQFRTCNRKKKGPKELSTGIGLNNIRQRLQLTYGPRHAFEIREDQHEYRTHLEINL